jgi:hypothetical protein
MIETWTVGYEQASTEAQAAQVVHDFLQNELENSVLLPVVCDTDNGRQEYGVRFHVDLVRLHPE